MTPKVTLVRNAEIADKFARINCKRTPKNQGAPCANTRARNMNARELTTSFNAID